MHQSERGERQVRVRPARDGEATPPGAELLLMDPKHDGDGWHEVESLSGPAQVATSAYREGYDRIFGGKKKVAEA